MRNNKKIKKTQQIFKSEKHNAFTEEVNEIAYDNKIMQSIDSIEIYAYRSSKDLVTGKEEIKCNNVIKRYKK